MKILLSICGFVLFFTFTSFAQSKATALFDENKNMRSVEFLIPPENIDDNTCKRLIASGTVYEVSFDVDEQIIYFRLTTKYKGKLENLYFYLPSEAYSRLRKEEVIKLPTLVKKGNKIKVIHYSCGTNAKSDEVDSIFRL